MPAKFKPPDVAIAACVLALVGVGLLANYSTSFAATGGGELIYFERQLIWAIIGLGGLLAAMMLPARVIQPLAYVVFGLSLLLLFVVLFAGKSGLGATRWFAIGSVRFQPSEVMKVALIVGIARLLSDHAKSVASARVIAGALLMGLVPMVLVMAEPDLGTAMVFPVTAFLSRRLRTGLRSFSLL